jgi:hypothetical protein
MAEWGPNFKKCVYHLKLGMHWILFLPDIRPAGYPNNPKARYKIKFILKKALTIIVFRKQNKA